MSDCRSFVCASKGCQNMIHLHHDVEYRLRQSHETFYCPAGHRNYFPSKTDEEKEIARLEARAERLERQRDMMQDRWSEALDERDEWKLQAKSCPFECGYRVLRKSKPSNISATLTWHLVEAHGAELPVVEEARA